MSQNICYKDICDEYEFCHLLPSITEEALTFALL